jgi:predicted small lipoprotein YifL
MFWRASKKREFLVLSLALSDCGAPGPLSPPTRVCVVGFTDSKKESSKCLSQLNSTSPVIPPQG